MLGIAELREGPKNGIHSWRVAHWLGQVATLPNLEIR